MPRFKKLHQMDDFAELRATVEETRGAATVLTMTMASMSHKDRQDLCWVCQKSMVSKVCPKCKHGICQGWTCLKKCDKCGSESCSLCMDKKYTATQEIILCPDCTEAE